ncbi:MAG: hypothetical protein SPJ65_06010 [Roseburia sp.]|nr:hypothetical protein [Roseburia sp.]
MRVRKPKHRNATINTRTMFYALYGKKIEIGDEFEKRIGYFEPVKFNACLSTGQSNAEESPFGANISYDRVISTVESLPIDENSIIWINTKPTYLEDGSVDGSTADYKVAAPPLDGLNSLRIAVKKVSNVTADNSSDSEDKEPDSGNSGTTDTDTDNGF